MKKPTVKHNLLTKQTDLTNFGFLVAFENELRYYNLYNIYINRYRQIRLKY